MAGHLMSEELKTRIEHEMDTRSVSVGVWLYRRTHGKITRLWHRRAIVLTTTGRRSGRLRNVLVQVFEDAPDLYVVAANSGLSKPPAWYLNLRADPHLTADLDRHRLNLRAELLPEGEAAERWQWMLGIAPDYDRYQERLGRVPPIFRLVTDEQDG